MDAALKKLTPEVLADVEGPTPVYPVTHGARVELPVLPSEELTLFDMMAG